MIKVYVKKKSNYPVNVPQIKKTLRDFLTKEGIVSDADVTVAIVGEKIMLDLARKYLKERGVLHNVLSFPFSDADVEFKLPVGNVIHLGDIVICYPKVVEEAKAEGRLIDDKVTELVKHGALHLMGKHHD